MNEYLLLLECFADLLDSGEINTKSQMTHAEVMAFYLCPIHYCGDAGGYHYFDADEFKSTVLKYTEVKGNA